MILLTAKTIFNYIVKVLEWGEDGMTTEDESDALQASFIQEVAVWHKLDHPNVTKVKIDSSVSYIRFCIDISIRS